MELSLLAREEKDTKDLCKRSLNFYKEASKQITKMESEAKYQEGIEKELFEESILADKRDLKSIKDLRIKKLVRMAVSDAYRGKPIHVLNNMLPAEIQLYHAIVEGIRMVREA